MIHIVKLNGFDLRDSDEKHKCTVGIISDGNNRGDYLFEGDVITEENARVIHLFPVCPVCGCDLNQEPKKVEVIERV